MQDIGVVVNRPPAVYRPQGSQVVYLTFEGLQETRAADRLTRIRISLPVSQVWRLWRQLATHVEDDEPTPDR